MTRAKNKTRPTGRSVASWLAGIRDDGRRRDCETLLRLMQKAVKAKPKMWGSIAGFGEYHYRYASGREGDWFQMGCANRKAELVLYVMDGPERHPALLAKLGRHRTGVCCLYIRWLADLDTAVLSKLLDASAREMRKRAA